MCTIDVKDFNREELTQKIVLIFQRVYSKLGHGYMEKAYKEAMMIEFKKERIPAESKSGVKVFYEGELINENDGYILLDNKVVIKIKAVDCLAGEDEMQLLDYLKAVNSSVGFLLNFGSTPAVKQTDNAKKSPIIINRL